MIATEILKGQGLGNQLFCYVTTRCIALDRNLPFGIKDTGWLGDKRYNSSGMYWFNLDLGEVVPDGLGIYEEKCVRRKTNTCWHDSVIGCDVRDYDEDLVNVKDNTMIFGIMQHEKYFIHHKEKIKQWLKVRPKYDCFDYSNSDTCILNFRGGEYVGFNELYLPREYWINAMKNMKNINPNMKFIIITDDVKAADKMFPEIPAYHFDVGKDYSIIKNSHYLIVSNSSFAFFPSFTSNTLKFAIAPKYWARHNVSDGYWSTNQNIYSHFSYQDRSGVLND
jgi:hypothetical protein